jgi:hypothetical protein
MLDAYLRIMCVVTHMHPGREQAPNPILLLGMERVEDDNGVGRPEMIVV